MPFEVVNRGKCATCEESKQLDEMVRMESKGRYQCIDCEVEQENLNYFGDLKGASVMVAPEQSKTCKLLAWCFG